jgi:hypothetical protein
MTLRTQNICQAPNLPDQPYRPTDHPFLAFVRSQPLCWARRQCDARFSDGSDLLHHAQLIPLVPALDDLSFDKSNYANPADAHAFARRWNTEIIALVVIVADHLRATLSSVPNASSTVT